MLSDYFEEQCIYNTSCKVGVFWNHKDPGLCTTWKSTVSSLHKARITLTLSALPIFMCKMCIISADPFWKLKNGAIPKQVKF